MMSPGLTLKDLTTDLFLKNLRNIPALIVAFDMLEIRFISQNTNYQIFYKAKINFLYCLKKILIGMELIVDQVHIDYISMDHDQLFSIKKTLDSISSSTSDLLKITKDKLDEIFYFTGLVEENFSQINISNQDRKKIKQEILIVEYELLNLK